MDIKEKLKNIRIAPVIGVCLICVAAFIYLKIDKPRASEREAGAEHIRRIAALPISRIDIGADPVIIKNNDRQMKVGPMVTLLPDVTSNLVAKLAAIRTGDPSPKAEVDETWSLMLHFPNGTNSSIVTLNASILKENETDVFVSALVPDLVPSATNKSVKVLALRSTPPALIPGAAQFFRDLLVSHKSSQQTESTATMLENFFHQPPKTETENEPSENPSDNDI